MAQEKKLSIRRFDRLWKKEGRREMFSGVHRYLRLHKELLEDPIYQKLYDYTRNTLIAYFKRDFKSKKASDEEYGKFIDRLADILSERSAEQVETFQWTVEKLYELDKAYPSLHNEIKI